MPEPSATIGKITMQIEIGEIVVMAETPVMGEIIVEGETVEDLGYTVDYDLARLAVGKALLSAAKTFTSDPRMKQHIDMLAADND